MHFNRNKTAEFGTWTQGNFISVSLRLTLQGAAAGLRAPCRELCLLLSGEVPEPGPLQVSSGQHRPLLLPQTSPPTSPALANGCTLVMAPLANRHLRSMRQVGLQDLLASFLTKPPKSHLVAGKAERWSLFCYVKTRLYGLFLKMSQ